VRIGWVGPSVEATKDKGGPQGPTFRVPADRA
jgi:hypothetical protein